MKLLPLLFVLLAASWLRAAEGALPLVSPIFGDHMVLQRTKPIRIWGWTTPESNVSVSLAGLTATARAGHDGRWQAELPPLPAGGPHTLQVDGGERREFTDILIGDVWLCGGQSNMEWGLAASKDGAAAVRAAAHPQIRLFRVANQVAYQPAAVPTGDWRVCAPEAFAGRDFSAVAYYFGRKVHAETGIPIGLIQVALGGSPVESWMSPAALAHSGEFPRELAELARLRDHAAGPAHGSFLMHWLDEFDRGGKNNAWAAPDLDDSSWKTTSLRDGFRALGVPEAPAIVWFRRTIELPDPLPAGPATIELGVVEKMDTVFVNGRWTGASSWVENPRRYTIPASALHPGKNVVAIRVFKLSPDGGFRTAPEKLRLAFGDGAALPLADGWRAALSEDARPPHPLPLSYENYPTMPAVLQLGMLHPITPLSLAGFLWYQGEANTTRAAQYRQLLPALIADWRALFRDDTLAFNLVQLPAFTARRDTPGSDGWAELREAQTATARTVPRTGLAVTIDTGDANNIHPTDKQPVGERLALLALRDTYGQPIIASGPQFARVEPLASGKLRVHFTHTENGLAIRGPRLGEFSVAGANRVWHWAEAIIDGDSVIVSSPAVPSPIAVRYAWQANPLATLRNGAGLPAAPFRSDDWPLFPP